MSTSILVTGASGNIGQELIRALAERPVKIRAVSRSAKGLQAAQNIETVQMDYADKAGILAALTGMSAAFFLLPVVPDMVELGNNFIEAAKQVNLPLTVRISALGADANSPIELFRLHGQIDDALKRSGLPHIILRPNAFMQNFSTMNIGSIRAEGKIYMPLGNGAASYIDVRDIAAVVAHLLMSPGTFLGKTLDLTGPESLTCDQVAKILSDGLPNPVSYVDVPEAMAEAGMKSQGMPEWLVNIVLELHGMMKASYSRDITSHVEEVTGKKPITFAQFVKDHAAVFAPTASTPVPSQR